MKEKSMPLSKYFELVKPKYIYLKITPHKSIRNYNSSNIIKAIAHTYRAINKRIYKLKKKIFFETSFKISYIIDIQNNNAEFYFLVPECFESVILEKIREIWSKATVERSGPIKDFSKDADYYEVKYKKEDALSLQVDRKSNEPLNGILSIIDNVKEEDRVTVIYNFIPRSQFGWLDQYETTMNKIKKNKSIVKDNLTFEQILKTGVGAVLSVFDSIVEVINDFSGGKPIQEQESLYSSVMKVLEQQSTLSATTKKKRESTIVGCQIGVVSESVDSTRRENNAIAVCQSFRALDEDNELIYKSCKPFNIEQENLNIEKNVISAEEGSNFVQLPGRTLLNYFKINHINVEESTVPGELLNGYIELGTNVFKGTKKEVFLEDHKDIGSLPLMMIGRQGGGKTTYIKNYVRNCKTRNEGVVHIDFIKNNESSKDIEKVINDAIILDFSTEEGLQSFAYNEIGYSDNMSMFEKQQLANKKTELTIQLIDSINESGEPLTPKMARYLSSCTDIVYLNEKATLKDVVRCLQDFKYRKEVIASIPKELKGELEEEVRALQELDEWSKPSKDNIPQIVGTREAKVEGIIDRVMLLKRDFYLKKMFNKSPDTNLNFVKALEEGKSILVRMPQAKFKNYVKNVITTFLITKCWLACELRGEMHEVNKRTHIIVDEISQAPTAEKFMESILTQTRKFGMKFVLTGQYMDQLKKQTIYTLKGAGASFMLLKGAIKEDFEYFKDEIEDSFEYEDLKNMKEYSSLNVVQYSKGYASFITKLPYKR